MESSFRYWAAWNRVLSFSDFRFEALERNRRSSGASSWATTLSDVKGACSRIMANRCPHSLNNCDFSVRKSWQSCAKEIESTLSSLSSKPICGRVFGLGRLHRSLKWNSCSAILLSLIGLTRFDQVSPYKWRTLRIRSAFADKWDRESRESCVNCRPWRFDTRSISKSEE